MRERKRERGSREWKEVEGEREGGREMTLVKRRGEEDDSVEVEEIKRGTLKGIWMEGRRKKTLQEEKEYRKIQKEGIMSPKIVYIEINQNQS